MDLGYLDFECLITLDVAGAFFVVRAKSHPSISAVTLNSRKNGRLKKVPIANRPTCTGSVRKK